MRIALLQYPIAYFFKDNLDNLCAAPTLRLAEKNNYSLAAEQYRGPYELRERVG